MSNKWDRGITSITVGGYKSIARESSIEIRPLTILAGANSSGKSSFFQSILLLKQTIEERFDPGALLLNGPNVRLTSSKQLLYCNKKFSLDKFYVGIEINKDVKVITHFKKRDKNKGFFIEEVQLINEQTNVKINPEMKSDEVKKAIKEIDVDMFNFMSNFSEMKIKERFDVPATKFDWRFNRDRCFLNPELYYVNDESKQVMKLNGPFDHNQMIARELSEMLHIPGLRGNPERTYPTTFISEDEDYPGTFEKYVASIITSWQESKQKLKQLGRYLQALGLTSAVKAELINDTEVELYVARLSKSNESGDFVSIADVGFGVSQTLPVLVALLHAKPGQLVYIEQPELHLHPKAQYEMAKILAAAAKRGIKVVIETHSSLLLRGIQTLVAKNDLPNEIIKLHWFTRNEEGITEIRSADLDKFGAFGDWPEDFDEIAMDAEINYLNAVESRGHS